MWPASVVASSGSLFLGFLLVAGGAYGLEVIVSVVCSAALIIDVIYFFCGAFAFGAAYLAFAAVSAHDAPALRFGGV